jgi:hypothetical protein
LQLGYSGRNSFAALFDIFDSGGIGEPDMFPRTEVFPRDDSDLGFFE